MGSKVLQALGVISLTLTHRAFSVVQTEAQKGKNRLWK